MSERTYFQDRARDLWCQRGKPLPEWVQGLAQECDRTSQSKVAKALGVSSAMISNIIGSQYQGDMKRAEDLYRGTFKSETLRCPALGDLKLDQCRMWRERSKKLISANARNVTMYRACNACPVNTSSEAEE